MIRFIPPSRLLRLAALLVLPLALTACDSGPETGLSGTFAGSSTFNNDTVELELDIEDNDGGQISGDASFSELGQTFSGDFEGNVVGDRLSVIVDVQDGSNEASLPYSGELNDDRDEIDGTLWAGENTVDITLDLDD